MNKIALFAFVLSGALLVGSGSIAAKEETTMPETNTVETEKITKDTILKTDGISVGLIKETEDALGYHFDMYLENDTKENVDISFVDIRINGTDIAPIWMKLCEAETEKSAGFVIRKQVLERYGIAEPESISFDIIVSDYATDEIIEEASYSHTVSLFVPKTTLR